MNSCIIFSVDRKENSERDNINSRIELEDILNEEVIPFKECEGVYKGTKEVSYLVDGKHEDTVQQLCQAFNQESYLYISKSYGVLKNRHGQEVSTQRFFRQIENYTIIDGEIFAAI